ncbi:UDP-N-acetylmuramoyl-tripeptide--D-alanyl-D-alanine ligase [Henriciella sp.]|uniref:UDP-N-acetylmuramoyl-tripeptide--D-alanyl-D- alanine ligase n=1 Tax=Henriciella sp. TaxID=1968823 RepID=UPI00260B9CA9|nr:UDP-N-acetylmuramoyl-tripeptide--D-alanyl-D-alanine ligase [Henriciella sp.]
MTRPLWTSDEIREATGGKVTAPFEVTGVSIDTRTMEPGDLFVALKDQRDGHDFVANAFEAGAGAALVSREIEGVEGPLIIVDDVMDAIEAMGVFARDRATGCHRVAVTGSVGKTSVKEMIARMFRAGGHAHWSVKSFNNHWGVPLTLARMPAETEYAVFEIGMSTPGEIAPRSQMVQPHTALVTKIAPAHLEGMGSIEGVAREKADIFAGLQPGGAIILPHEDAFCALMKEIALRHQPGAEVYTFGRSEDASARVELYRTDGDRSVIGVKALATFWEARINTVGEHWAENVAAAILAACVGSGISFHIAEEALWGYAPPPGRGTSEELPLPRGGSMILVDDAYNANPESMRAALSSFAARPGNRHIVALGEMLEVGSASETEHCSLADPVLESGATLAFLAGEGMKPLADSLKGRIETHWAVKAKELETVVKNSLTNGDLLLIKGSNASGMGQLADRLRQWSKAADEQVMDRGPEGAAGGADAV